MDVYKSSYMVVGFLEKSVDWARHKCPLSVLTSVRILKAG